MAYKRTGLTLKNEEYDALVGKLKDMGYSCLSEFIRIGILQGKANDSKNEGQPVEDPRLANGPFPFENSVRVQCPCSTWLSVKVKVGLDAFGLPMVENTSLEKFKERLNEIKIRG